MIELKEVLRLQREGLLDELVRSGDVRRAREDDCEQDEATDEGTNAENKW
jgi:hypothetical protein